MITNNSIKEFDTLKEIDMFTELVIVGKNNIQNLSLVPNEYKNGLSTTLHHTNASF